MRDWSLRIIGFVAGAAVTFLLEYALLVLLGEIFDRRFLPRSAGWVIMPLVVGTAIAKIAPEIIPTSKLAKQGIIKSYWNASPLARFVVVAPVFWVLAVSAYILLFEPYGYRVTSRDYEHMFKVLLFPPVVLVIGYFVYNKLIKPSRTDIRSGSHGDDS